jgi:hypothetical protein
MSFKETTCQLKPGTTSQPKQVQEWWRVCMRARPIAILLISFFVVLAELCGHQIEFTRSLIEANSLVSKTVSVKLHITSVNLRNLEKAETIQPKIHFHLIFTHLDRQMKKKNRSPPSILHFRSIPNDAYTPLYNFKHRRVLESIFYHHRDAHVTIHTNYMTMKDFECFTAAGYNIELRKLEFAKVAKSTPLEGVERQARFRMWESGIYWYTSFSNIYRLLVLYQEGGVYIDSDMIVTRPFDDLDNAIGSQSRNFANNAVLVFKKPGNAFVYDCLLEMNNTYSTILWGFNGPGLVSRVLKRWEKRSNASDSIRLLSQESFFLFRYQSIVQHCFLNNASKSELLYYAKVLADRVPYAVHTNNKITGSGKTSLANGTLCHYLFTRFCVLCEAEPARPACYPLIEGNDATVSLP